MLLDTERDMQKRWDKGYKKRQAHMMGPSVQVKDDIFDKQSFVQ